jgi:hypothetical protein
VVATGTVRGGAFEVAASAPLTAGAQALTAVETDAAGLRSDASVPADYYVLPTTAVTPLTGGPETIIATAGTLSREDILAPAGGAGALDLIGGGAFNLAVPAALSDIATLQAQEGMGAGAQVVTLRPGLDLTVDVASVPGGKITIVGAANTDVINLGDGADTVEVGGPLETIIGGDGVATIEVTAATIGATIDRGGGSTTLNVASGGEVVMGANITGVQTVNLSALTVFTANTLPGLAITGSGGDDTIIADGSARPLTGGAGTDTLIGWAGGNDPESLEKLFDLHAKIGSVALARKPARRASTPP